MKTRKKQRCREDGGPLHLACTDASIELLITANELQRHLDFVLDILAVELTIGVVHDGGLLVLVHPTLFEHLVDDELRGVKRSNRLRLPSRGEHS